MMLFSKLRFDAQGRAVNLKLASQFKLRAAAIAVASCMSMAPWLAEAAGLGKITVLSNLGQPLRAEVEVSATREELAGMVARLAPQEAFRQASIDYASGLSDLRFTLDKRPSGTSVIRVTSSKPVNEPFLDFLIELNWPAGRLVREYTFLLDPPEVATKSAGKAISVAEAKPVATVRGGAELEAAPAAKPAPKETPARAETKPKAAESEAKKTEGGNTHVVKQGETLRKIASENQYEGVSLEQMLVGLFRANSDAFIGANVNRMRAGAILTIPEKETVAAIPEAEAKKEFRAQSADWNAYRKKLAAAAAQGPAKDETGSQAAGGKITAKVEERASPAEAQKDQVKVTRSDAGAKGTGAGKGKTVSDEEVIAKDKALKEAQERLAMLEKNVSELQKLVEMKNQRLAELQKQAAAPKPEEVKPPVAAVKSPEPPKAPEPVKPVEAPKAPEPAKVEAPKPVEPPKVEEAPKPAEAPKVAEAPKPAEPPKVEAPKTAEPRKVTPPPPAPEPEPDFLDEFGLPLAGGGGILALLAGYFFYKRRRSGEATSSTSTAVPHPSSLGPNSVFRATGGQSVDTGNTTPQTTDFSQTGPGTIDTDEVDPVAEADVYMAYGRDAQAEEILLEALQKDPQRTAIHAKLLEIYAGRKSLKQFETLAGELYAQTGGVGAEWEKVAAMGAKLDPSNPLYSGARTAVGGVEAFDADATMIVSPADALKSTIAAPGTLSQMAEAAAGSEVPAIPDLDLSAALIAEAPAARNEAPAEEAKAGEAELMSLDFDLETATPAAPTAEATPPAAKEELVADTATDVPADVLDFDLGSTPAPEAAAAAELHVPAEMPEIEEAAALDFDLGLAAPAASSEEVAKASDESVDSMVNTVVGPEAMEVGKAAREAQEAAANMIDFELDIGSPAAQTVVNPEAVARIEEAMASPVEEEVLDLGAVDADALEFDVKLSESTVLGQPMQAPSFDMTSINLDLSAEPLAEAGLETVVMPEVQTIDATESVEAELPAATDAHWEEVNTKLDLAKAYEEMGDVEGARELLQEVVNEGSADLVEQAQAILARLNG